VSGGGGGIIIIHSIKAMLSDPHVHGSLPADIQAAVAAVLAKSIWSNGDKEIILDAIGWALDNLA
jgi:hypothetical protein